MRARHGAVEHTLYRSPDDANRLVIHLDFPTEEAMQAFMDDPSLRQAMERGGVEGEPGVSVTRRVERKSCVDGASAGVSLVVWHKVADCDTWKPVFDEHEDVRRGHGELEHRVYRPVGEANVVVVHNDSRTEAEAQSFMADASLPAAMERACVDGGPWLGRIERVERKTYA